MYTAIEDTKPTIEERLANATNSSNLVPTRMDDDGGRIGTLEILTTAGWTSKTVEYAIGRNLIALHSEWDGAERPRAPRPHDIERIAAKLPPMVDIEVVAADGSKTRKSVPRLVAAKAESTKWYDLERQRLAGKLNTMPVAQVGLVEWTTLKEILRRDALAKPTANAVDRDHTSAASR